MLLHDVPRIAAEIFSVMSHVRSTVVRRSWYINTLGTTRILLLRRSKMTELPTVGTEIFRAVKVAFV